MYDTTFKKILGCIVIGICIISIICAFGCRYPKEKTYSNMENDLKNITMDTSESKATQDLESGYFYYNKLTPTNEVLTTDQEKARSYLLKELNNKYGNNKDFTIIKYQGYIEQSDETCDPSYELRYTCKDKNDIYFNCWYEVIKNKATNELKLTMRDNYQEVFYSSIINNNLKGILLSYYDDPTCDITLNMNNLVNADGLIFENGYNFVKYSDSKVQIKTLYKLNTQSKEKVLAELSPIIDKSRITFLETKANNEK